MPETLLGKAEYAIFDMDGLLSGSQKVVAVGYADWQYSLLRKYGFTKPYGWEYKVQTMGRPPRQSAETLFSFYPGLSDKISIDEWIAERSILHEQAFKKVKPLKGAVELVKRLHDAGVGIAIATGSNMANFRWKTDHLPELFGLFPPHLIFTSESGVGRGKPYPDIYLRAARGLGQDVGTPDEVTNAQLANRAKGLVFEDAVLGVNAGVAAGMKVIWVPHHEVREMYPNETFGAVQVLDSLAEFKPERWALPGV